MLLAHLMAGWRCDLHEVEKKMKQMMKFKEHMLKDAKANIDQAQSRYKQDYDRTQSASEV